MSKILIEVTYFGPVKNATGIEEEKVSLEEGQLILDLLTLLSNKFGQKFESLIFDQKSKHNSQLLREGIVVLLNGESCEMTSQLDNGDKVVFVTAIGGG